jgi:hypothetical protein
VILTVHVKTRAKRDEIVAWLDETTVKVAVSAPPEKGKANESVLRVLAEAIGVSQSELTIVRGASIPMKHVEIPLTPDQLRRATKDYNEKSGR